jgi:hypothetical protein
MVEIVVSMRCGRGAGATPRGILSGSCPYPLFVND